MMTVINFIINYFLAVFMMFTICPAVQGHPDTYEASAYFTAKNPEIGFQIMANNQLWCDSCGMPYQVDELTWVNFEGTEMLFCPFCKDYFNL